MLSEFHCYDHYSYITDTLDRLQDVLKEETDGYSSAKALLEAPVVGMCVCIILSCSNSLCHGWLSLLLYNELVADFVDPQQ